MTPADYREIILSFKDFILRDIVTALIFLIILILILWLILKPILNYDDIAWGIFTFIIMTAIFYVIIQLAADGKITIDLKAIYESLKSAFTA